MASIAADSAAARKGSGGEYADQFQAPAPGTEKATSARHEDQFSLMPLADGDAAASSNEIRSAETAEHIGRNVGGVLKPDRGKAKVDFLALNGRMEYSPEYR